MMMIIIMKKKEFTNWKLHTPENMAPGSFKLFKVAAKSVTSYRSPMPLGECLWMVFLSYFVVAVF